MITLLKWLVERWKIILVAFTILALLAMIEFYRSECTNLRIQYTELEDKYNQKQYELAVAENSVKNLKISLQLKTTEAQGIDELLRVNYEGMQKLSKDLAEIDAIMYDLSGPAEEQSEEQKNAAINSQQNKAGVDLINRQLQSIN